MNTIAGFNWAGGLVKSHRGSLVAGGEGRFGVGFSAYGVEDLRALHDEGRVVKPGAGRRNDGAVGVFEVGGEGSNRARDAGFGDVVVIPFSVNILKLFSF